MFRVDTFCLNPSQHELITDTDLDQTRFVLLNTQGNGAVTVTGSRPKGLTSRSNCLPVGSTSKTAAKRLVEFAGTSGLTVSNVLAWLWGTLSESISRTPLNEAVKGSSSA